MSYDLMSLLSADTCWSSARHGDATGVLSLSHPSHLAFSYTQVTNIIPSVFTIIMAIGLQSIGLSIRLN